MKNGLSQTWSPKTGKLRMKKTYTNGVLIGNSIIYHSNGTEYYKEEFQNGQSVGHCEIGKTNGTNLGYVSTEKCMDYIMSDENNPMLSDF